MLTNYIANDSGAEPPEVGSGPDSKVSSPYPYAFHQTHTAYKYCLHSVPDFIELCRTWYQDYIMRLCNMVVLYQRALSSFLSREAVT